MLRGSMRLSWGSSIGCAPHMPYSLIRDVLNLRARRADRTPVARSISSAGIRTSVGTLSNLTLLIEGVDSIRIFLVLAKQIAILLVAEVMTKFTSPRLALCHRYLRGKSGAGVTGFDPGAGCGSSDLPQPNRASIIAAVAANKRGKVIIFSVKAN